MYVCAHVCMYVCMYVQHTGVYVSLSISLCTYICVHIHICKCIKVYICVYICMLVCSLSPSLCLYKMFSSLVITAVDILTHVSAPVRTTFYIKERHGQRPARSSAVLDCQNPTRLSCKAGEEGERE